MGRKVVLTGAGVASPLGDTPAALHAALCAGRSGLAVTDRFRAEGFASPVCAEIADFDAEKYLGPRNLRPLDRTGQLLAAAARLALDSGGWTSEARSGQEIGLVVGTMFCSVRTIAAFDRRAQLAGPAFASPMDFANTVINAAGGQAAILHDLRGLNATVAAGATSGLQALAYAADAIRAGYATTVLAGGVEELCFESFYGFHRAGLLSAVAGGAAFPIPFDAHRDGFVLGEGAAVLVLEEGESAAARGASVLAEIWGHGSAFDPSGGQDERQATATIARALRLALHDAGLSAADLDCVSASANGSPWLDRREAQVLAAALPRRAAELPVMAVKSMLGEALGASGALQVIALVEALRAEEICGVRGLEATDPDCPLRGVSAVARRAAVRTGLVNAVGLDGHGCSLIVGRARVA
jgi:3-oxoacyl-[acyl-carrier-protein] synthase II